MAGSTILTAQTKNISHGNQQWLQYYNQIKLSEKWTWLSDLGYRWEDGFESSTQYVLRTGLGYTVNPNLKIATGFAHLGFYSSGKVSRVEFRPYQELSMEHKLNKIGVNHRFRIEERFFNPVVNGEIQSPNTFNFRFRYAITASVPLFTLSESNPDRKLSLNVGNEIFINGGKTVVYNIFDQNRFTISPTVHFSKNLNASVTWVSQFAASNMPASYNYRNVIWFQIRQKLDFTKKSPEK